MNKATSWFRKTVQANLKRLVGSGSLDWDVDQSESIDSPVYSAMDESGDIFDVYELETGKWQYRRSSRSGEVKSSLEFDSADEAMRRAEGASKTARKTSSLDSQMGFDHVVEVHADGSVTDAQGVYAPSVYDWETNTGLPEMDGSGWSFFSDGYTGQYGYSGPVMHASEFIGGRLEKDILAEPGLYVVVSVEDMNDGDEPFGWAVLRKDASKTASRKQARWATLDNGPRDFFPDQLKAQIGMGNIFAISGGRIEVHDNGFRLPVAYGYAVVIFLEANDTYTVQTTFTRSGKTTVKHEWTDIYANQVGEAAYQASLFRDLKNSSKAVGKTGTGMFSPPRSWQVVIDGEDKWVDLLNCEMQEDGDWLCEYVKPGSGETETVLIPSHFSRSKNSSKTAGLYQDIVGRQWLGMPGSVVLKAWPIVNDAETFQAGSPPALVELQLGDGRVVRMPTHEKTMIDNLSMEGLGRGSSKKTAMPNPVDLGVEVGTIFVSSWGYDQTNVDFYQVIRLMPASVELRPIGKHYTETGFMSGTSVPIPDNFVGGPFTKRVTGGWRGDGAWINLTSYSGASVWDGQPERESHYAKKTAKKTFEEWMAAVDRAIQSKVGLSSSDLADWPFRDAYDSGEAPGSVARALLRSEGFYGSKKTAVGSDVSNSEVAQKFGSKTALSGLWEWMDDIDIGFLSSDTNQATAYVGSDEVAYVEEKQDGSWEWAVFGERDSQGHKRILSESNGVAATREEAMRAAEFAGIPFPNQDKFDFAVGKTANRNLMYVPDDGGGAIMNSDGLSLRDFVEYLRDLDHEGGYITNQNGGRQDLDSFEASRKVAYDPEMASLFNLMDQQIEDMQGVPRADTLPCPDHPGVEAEKGQTYASFPMAYTEYDCPEGHIFRVKVGTTREDMTAEGSRKTAELFYSTLQRLALNEQSGHAESDLDDVEVNDDNADEKEMWPWEIGKVSSFPYLDDRPESYREGYTQGYFDGHASWTGDESNLVGMDRPSDEQFSQGYSDGYAVWTDLLPPTNSHIGLNVWAQNNHQGNVQDQLDQLRGRANEKPELISAAENSYNLRDQSWFDSQSLEDLKFLWEVNPMGMNFSWDDEVYEALYSKGYFKESRKQATDDPKDVEVTDEQAQESMFDEGWAEMGAEGSRADYEHWNEEADRVWYEEEGRHGDSGMSKDDYLELMSREDFDIDDVEDFDIGDLDDEGFYGSKTAEWYDEVDDSDDSDGGDAVEGDESASKEVKEEPDDSEGEDEGIEKDALSAFRKIVQANMMEMR